MGPKLLVLHASIREEVWRSVLHISNFHHQFIASCALLGFFEGDVVESRRKQDICGVNKVVFNFCPSVFGK